ncbi:glutathione peroxidase-like [Brevipalpus obovatus]|uniref:glutathione peroxidase-like n=1 Tax=Brevipalpus obovatus TaxID=246614 RepID=UPI003D9F1F18
MMTRSRSNPKKTEGKNDKAAPKAASSRPAKKQKKEPKSKDDKKSNSNGITESSSSAANIFEFTVKDIDGNDVCLDKYKGFVTIIVNVASRCGYTKKNYEQLNEVYDKFYDAGLRIAAFPCNQFKSQEPGDSEKIKAFTEKKGVKFDVYEKINVNGAEAHPLYQYLKSAADDTNLPIKWNFNKFIVNKKGVPVKRYQSGKNPLDMIPDIEAELAKKG